MDRLSQTTTVLRADTSPNEHLELNLVIKEVFFKKAGKYLLRISLLSEQSPRLLPDVEVNIGQSSVYRSYKGATSQLIDWSNQNSSSKSFSNFSDSFTFKFPKGVSANDLERHVGLKLEAVMVEKNGEFLDVPEKICQVVLQHGEHNLQMNKDEVKKVELHTEKRNFYTFFGRVFYNSSLKVHANRNNLRTHDLFQPIRNIISPISSSGTSSKSLQSTCRFSNPTLYTTPCSSSAAILGSQQHSCSTITELRPEAVESEFSPEERRDGFRLAKNGLISSKLSSQIAHNFTHSAITYVSSNSHISATTIFTTTEDDQVSNQYIYTKVAKYRKSACDKSKKVSWLDEVYSSETQENNHESVEAYGTSNDIDDDEKSSSEFVAYEAPNNLEDLIEELYHAPSGGERCRKSYPISNTFKDIRSERAIDSVEDYVKFWQDISEDKKDTSESFVCSSANLMARTKQLLDEVLMVNTEHGGVRANEITPSGSVDDKSKAKQNSKRRKSKQKKANNSLRHEIEKEIKNSSKAIASMENELENSLQEASTKEDKSDSEDKSKESWKPTWTDRKLKDSLKKQGSSQEKSKDSSTWSKRNSLANKPKESWKLKNTNDDDVTETNDGPKKTKSQICASCCCPPEMCFEEGWVDAGDSISKDSLDTNAECKTKQENVKPSESYANTHGVSIPAFFFDSNYFRTFDYFPDEGVDTSTQHSLKLKKSTSNEEVESLKTFESAGKMSRHNPKLTTSNATVDSLKSFELEEEKSQISLKVIKSVENGTADSLKTCDLSKRKTAGLKQVPDSKITCGLKIQTEIPADQQDLEPTEALTCFPDELAEKDSQISWTTCETAKEKLQDDLKLTKSTEDNSQDSLKNEKSAEKETAGNIVPNKSIPRETNDYVTVNGEAYLDDDSYLPSSLQAYSNQSVSCFLNESPENGSEYSLLRTEDVVCIKKTKTEPEEQQKDAATLRSNNVENDVSFFPDDSAEKDSQDSLIRTKDIMTITKTESTSEEQQNSAETMRCAINYVEKDTRFFPGESAEKDSQGSLKQTEDIICIKKTKTAPEEQQKDAATLRSNNVDKDVSIFPDYSAEKDSEDSLMRTKDIMIITKTESTSEEEQNSVETVRCASNYVEKDISFFPGESAEKDSLKHTEDIMCIMKTKSTTDKQQTNAETTECASNNVEKTEKESDSCVKNNSLVVEGVVSNEDTSLRLNTSHGDLNRGADIRARNELRVIEEIVEYDCVLDGHDDHWNRRFEECLDVAENDSHDSIYQDTLDHLEEVAPCNEEVDLMYKENMANISAISLVTEIALPLTKKTAVEALQTDPVIVIPVSDTMPCVSMPSRFMLLDSHSAASTGQLYVSHVHESSPGDCLACELQKAKVLEISRRSGENVGFLQCFDPCDAAAYGGSDSLLVGMFGTVDQNKVALTNNEGRQAVEAVCEKKQVQADNENKQLVVKETVNECKTNENLDVEKKHGVLATNNSGTQKMEKPICFLDRQVENEDKQVVKETGNEMNKNKTNENLDAAKKHKAANNSGKHHVEETSCAVQGENQVKKENKQIQKDSSFSDKMCKDKLTVRISKRKDIMSKTCSQEDSNDSFKIRQNKSVVKESHTQFVKSKSLQKERSEPLHPVKPRTLRKEKSLELPKVTSSQNLQQRKFSFNFDGEQNRDFLRQLGNVSVVQNSHALQPFHSKEFFSRWPKKSADAVTLQEKRAKAQDKALMEIEARFERDVKQRIREKQLQAKKEKRRRHSEKDGEHSIKKGRRRLSNDDDHGKDRSLKKPRHHKDGNVADHHTAVKPYHPQQHHPQQHHRQQHNQHHTDRRPRHRSTGIHKSEHKKPYLTSTETNKAQRAAINKLNEILNNDRRRNFEKEIQEKGSHLFELVQKDGSNGSFEIVERDPKIHSSTIRFQKGPTYKDSSVLVNDSAGSKRSGRSGDMRKPSVIFPRMKAIPRSNNGRRQGTIDQDLKTMESINRRSSVILRELQRFRTKGGSYR